MKLNKILLMIVMLVLVSSFASAENYARGLENNSIIWVKTNISAGVPLFITLTNVTSYPENPENVFLLYDNFTNSTLNTSKWTLTGSPTYGISAGVLSITSATNVNHIRSANAYNLSGNTNLGLYLMSGAYCNAGTTYSSMSMSVGDTLTMTNFNVNGTENFWACGADQPSKVYLSGYSNGSTGNTGYVAVGVAGTVNTLTGLWMRKNLSQATRNTGTVNLSFAPYLNGSMKVKLSGSGSGSINYWDWIQLVKRNANEPTISCNNNLCTINSNDTLIDYQLPLSTTLTGDLNITSSTASIIYLNTTSPLNTTYAFNLTPLFIGTVNTIGGTFNISLILNDSNKGTLNNVSSTGLFNITSSTLTPGTEYTWWFNATDATNFTNTFISDKRNIYIAGATSNQTCNATATKTCVFTAGCVGLNCITSCI